MSSPAKTFSQLLKQVAKDFPGISFNSGQAFSWSADEQTIYYNSSADHPTWSLLHELGHMAHQHDAYNSDNALIRIEMEAWTSALDIADRYDIVIENDHIQDCMDSYRYWQRKRSTCPQCSLAGLELTSGSYRCISCKDTWEVGSDRFCRVYRRSASSVR